MPSSTPPPIFTPRTEYTQPGRPLDRYLNELIDHCGEPYTHAEAILDMQSLGMDQPCIDRWLQGNDLAQRLRARHARITTRIFLLDPRRRTAS